MQKFIYNVIIAILLLPLTACHDVDDISIPNSSERLGASRSGQVLEYPTAEEIWNSDEFFYAATAAWDKMLTYVTETSRREIGFYIYYNHSSNTYTIGEWSYGPLVPYAGGEPAYVNLGTPLFPLKLCAFFHCHAPYYGPGHREGGPSQADINVANQLGVPGLLLDYNYDYLWPGYPYEYDSPIIYTFGPEQRAPHYY